MRDNTGVAKNMIYNNEKSTLEDQATVEPFQNDSHDGAKKELDLPYKGLNPYTEADTSIFFGREKDIQDVVNNLLAWPLTILYGKSGVGKSSVLRAGVTHTLNEKARQNIADYDGWPKLAIVVFPSLKEGGFSWKDDPLAGLMRHIEETIAYNRWGIPSPTPGLSFVDTLRGWTEALGGEDDDGELYLVLDQFEEYFLYHAEEKGEGTFFTEFPRAVNCLDLRVNFLISIREDSIADLDRFQSLIPNLFEHRLQIGHLDRQAGREAIIKPIDYYNQKHGTSIDIEPKLVDKVLDQVQVGKVVFGESGIGGSAVKLESGIEGSDVQSKPSPEIQIETPYLQLVMERLWKEEVEDKKSYLLRLETFEALGHADRIVKDHLNYQMQLLTEKERQIAASIFQHLVTSSGAKYAYSVEDLLGEPGSDKPKIDPTQLKQLLEKLSSGKQRILRPVGLAKRNQPNTQRYEIFHDALASAILDWRGRYLEKQKIEKETENLRVKAEKQLFEAEKQRVEAEKQRVEAAQQRAKVEKRLGSALIATSIVALASLGMLGYQLQRSQERFERTREIATLNLQGSQALAQWETSDQLDTLQLAMQAGQTVKTRNLLQRAPTPALALQQILYHIREQNQWQVFDRVASGFGQSPDGQWLAVGSIDGELSLWNFQQQQWTAPFPTQGGQIYGVDLSRDGGRIATASADGQVRVWSKDGQLIQTFLSQRVIQGSSGLFPISLSPDGQTIAIASGTSVIELRDVNTGEQISSRDIVAGNEALDRVFRVRFSPDGKQLAIASRGTIALWNLQDNRLTSWTGHEGGVIFDLRFSPRDQRLVSASSDKTAKLWDLEGHRLWIFKGHESAVFSVAFTSDGTRLATGSSDGTARVWNLAAGSDQFGEVEGTEWLKLSGHDSDVMTVSFSQDNQRLATMTRSTMASLWNLSERRPTSFNLPSGQWERARAFSQSVFSPNGQQLATASLDGDARLWDLKGKQLKLFPGDAGPMDRIPRVFFSQDGQQLATISGYGTARLWNLNSESEPKILFTGQTDQWVIGLDLSPDHSRLVTTTEQGIVRVWDFQGHQLKKLPGHWNRATDADFSPDGRWLATASWDGTARLWDLQSGQSQELTGHQGMLTMVRFSPDGQQFATASQDGTARLWDLQGNQIQSFAQGSPVMSVRFSPDGQRLATASWNNTARIWNLQGNPLAEYQGDAGLWDASFSPDGTQLATVGWRGTGQLWSVKTLDQLLQDGCAWTKEHLATDPKAKQALSFCRN